MAGAMLNTAQVAEALDRSEWFVVQELRRKNLRGSKIGGKWSVRPGDVEAYIEAHMNVREVRS